jgi:hypothetical protein
MARTMRSGSDRPPQRPEHIRIASHLIFNRLIVSYRNHPVTSVVLLAPALVHSPPPRGWRADTARVPRGSRGQTPSGHPAGIKTPLQVCVRHLRSHL